MSTPRHGGRWLWALVKVVVVAVIAISPGFIVALCNSSSSAISWSTRLGMILQLLGFLLAGWQIRKALKDHKQPNLWARIKKWWSERPCREPSATTAAGAALLGGVTVSGYARVRDNPADSSTSARIDALQKNHELLQQEVDLLRERVDAAARDLAARIEGETRSRAQLESDVQSRFRETAVGNADLQTTGLIWFVTGTIFATAAPDIARLLGQLT